MTASWTVRSGDIEALEHGARLLGAGGGGDPSVLSLIVRRAMPATGVEVLDPARLPAAGRVITSALVGAPALQAELLPRGDEFDQAFAGLERRLGERAVAVMGLETAGANVFPPLLVAAMRGLPVLDIDGMARAFPRLDQTVFHARGAAAGPLTLCSPGGELVLIDVEDAPRAEELARAVLPALGGWAAMASFALRVGAAARLGAHGALRRALELGRAALGARGPQELADRCGARLLGIGSVLAVERPERARAGGWVLVEPMGAPGATLRIEYQTEYLVAAIDGRVLAATPDMIAVVGGHDLVPVPCEAVRGGDDVAVLVLPAHPAWSDPAAAPLGGPAAFGYGSAVQA